MPTPSKSFFLGDEIYAYLLAHNRPVDPVLAELAEETAALGAIAVMQIAPEQGALITLLVRATGARRAVEVGTFTGYSAICIARGLPPDGHLLACDVSEEWTATARRYWERAGVADRIELRLGPAADTLRSLPATEDLDIAFIDADKPAYPTYYEELIRRLRPNGLILIDNVLQRGEVVRHDTGDPNVEAIRAFNELVLGDDRVDLVMLAVSDGLTIVRKR